MADYYQNRKTEVNPPNTQSCERLFVILTACYIEVFHYTSSQVVTCVPCHVFIRQLKYHLMINLSLRK